MSPLPDDNTLDAYLDRGISAAFEDEPTSTGSDTRSGTLRPVRAPRTTRIPDVVGPYPVTSVLGRGGMGLVLRAQDPQLGRELAIKLLDEAHIDDEELVARFEDEARVCSRLQHPGIVPVHEIGATAEGLPYFTMRLIEGETLAARLRRRAAPSEDRSRLLDVFVRVCEAMAYAHDCGVVHRDLKPENVMVGAFGEVQIMDWGFASSDSSDGQPARPKPVPLRYRVVGTPAYMSPEQARGQLERIDARADVFALGAMLCEIVTGDPPYVADTKEETLLLASKAWIEDARERLRSSGAEARLTAIAERCLAPEPAERPAQAGDVERELADYMASLEETRRRLELEAAEARATAQLERRARRLTVWLAAATVITVLVAAASVLWVERERRARASETARAVAVALERASSLRGEARREAGGGAAKWTEAIAAAEGAVLLAGTRGADEGTRAAADALVAELHAERARVERDHALVEQLLEIKPHFGDGRRLERLDADFSEAFSAYGVDVLASNQDEAARLLGVSSVLAAVVSGLDDWAMARIAVDGVDSESSRTLVELANRLDRDPWRSDLRRALLAKDGPGIRRLAAPAELESIPIASLDLLARCLRLVGSAEDAIAVYRVAHARRPEDFQINHNLGSLLRSRDLFDEEVARMFAMAAVARPSSVHVLADLAQSFVAREEDERALVYLRRIHALDPGYAPGWYYRGLIRLRAEDWIGAEECFRTVLRIDPHDGRPHGNLSVALAEQGRVREALEASQEAVRLRPDSAQHVANLSLQQVRLGREEDAVESARRWIALAPRDARARFHLGLSLHTLGRYEGAIAAFGEAIDLDPELADAWCHRGHAMLLVGSFEEALRNLNTADALSNELDSELSGVWAVLTRQAEALIDVEAELDEALVGRREPNGATERILFALVASRRGQPLFAFQQFELAFRQDPRAMHRGRPTNATVAAQAAFAISDPGVDAAERKLWREQACEWLWDELVSFELDFDQLEGANGVVGLLRLVKGWTRGTALPHPGSPLYAGLDQAEREAWDELWAAVSVFVDELECALP